MIYNSWIFETVTIYYKNIGVDNFLLPPPLVFYWPTPLMQTFRLLDLITSLYVFQKSPNSVHIYFALFYLKKLNMSLKYTSLALFIFSRIIHVFHNSPSAHKIISYILYRVRHNYGNTHFIIVLDKKQSNLKFSWIC